MELDDWMEQLPPHEMVDGVIMVATAEHAKAVVAVAPDEALVSITDPAEELAFFGWMLGHG